MSFNTLQLTDFYEEVDNIGPSIATVSQDRGSATIPYYLWVQPGIIQANFNIKDVLSAITTLLGYTNTQQNNGNQNQGINLRGGYRLNRSLPVAHPILTQWYADTISSIRGIGSFSKRANNPTLESTYVMPFAASYNNWKLDVHFSPRPYAVVDDTKIDVKTVSWQTPPIAAGGGGMIKSNIATEWRRFTVPDYAPQNDYITGVKGRSYFISSTSAQVNNSSFQGMPRVFLPNSLFKLIWHQVPYRYILSPNSYVNMLRGYINQFPFYETPYNNGFMFPAASLLYLGYNLKIYTSPVAQLMGWPGGIISSKYCDIELLFLVTRRVIATGEAPATGNANLLAAGHNLQIYFPFRNWYYVVYADKNGGKKYPYFFSAPFELLFTDPDSPQPTPITML